MSETKLWEILVPTMIDRETRGGSELTPIRTRYHKVWDKKVLAVSNGITIMRPTIKGVWFENDKKHVDRTIPVRIACSKDEIIKIAKIARDHYNQLEIMVYCISTEVLFVGE